jgi:tetratricopeptide (TPR) repeat protein
MTLVASQLAVALLLVAAPPRHEAERLFNAGTVAYQAGRYEEALADFAASYEALPLAQILFDIAQCDRKLGRWKEAELHYQGFLSAEPKAANRSEVLDYLKQVRDAEAGPPQEPTPAPPPPGQVAVAPNALKLDAPPPAPPLAAVEPLPPPAHASRGPYWLGGSGLLVALAGGACLIAGEVIQGGDAPASSNHETYHTLTAPQVGTINGLLVASYALFGIGAAALAGGGIWAALAPPAGAAP